MDVYTEKKSYPRLDHFTDIVLNDFYSFVDACFIRAGYTPSFIRNSKYLHITSSDRYGFACIYHFKDRDLFMTDVEKSYDVVTDKVLYLFICKFYEEEEND